MARKSISKKVRFEVFKRDNFTCQYCGRMAPDVVLEIDHINPVKNGGTNDIMNLITSCFDCNRGKGKRKLSEKDELKMQQEQLKILNQKREQLKMLLSWKKELQNLDEEMVDEIENILSITGYSFSEYGRKNCIKDIKKYGFEEVYESAKISLEQYYIENDKESISKVFNYIGKICNMREKQKNNPNLYKINYLCKIAKNRIYNYNYNNENKLKLFLKKYLDEKNFEDLKYLFCTCTNWYILKEELENYFEEEI